MSIVYFANSQSPGIIPNFDQSHNLGFLTQSGVIRNFTSPAAVVADVTTNTNTILLVGLNDETLQEFEISLYGVANTAATTAIITVSLWLFPLVLTGNLGVYTAPVTPLATISLTVPSGAWPVVYGATTFAASATQGAGLGVSLQVSNIPSSSGLFYLGRYLSLVSGPTPNTVPVAYGMWYGNDVISTAATDALTFPNAFVTPIGITQVGTTEFQVALAGTYEVNFQVPVVSAGMLDIYINAVEQPDTVVGRSTGTCQIVGAGIILVLNASDQISVRVPTGAAVVVTENDVAPITLRPLTRNISIKQIA